MQTKTYSTLHRLAAWGVHLFTASGMAAGFMALPAISDNRFKEAIFWLIISQLIDGFDGLMARALQVSNVLPHVNGKMIDYVIDFANYALIPAYFIYACGRLDAPFDLIAAIYILLISAIYYGKDGMVSEDNYFVGFPVMWNLVAFYLYFVLDLPSLVNVLLIAVLGLLHFVPIKFLYPSRALKSKGAAIGLALIWISVIGLILWLHPTVHPWLNGLALAILLFFGAKAAWDTWLSPRPDAKSR